MQRIWCVLRRISYCVIIEKWIYMNIIENWILELLNTAIMSNRTLMSICYYKSQNWIKLRFWLEKCLNSELWEIFKQTINLGKSTYTYAKWFEFVIWHWITSCVCHNVKQIDQLIRFLKNVYSKFVAMTILHC